jgi:hypothetical protein
MGWLLLVLVLRRCGKSLPKVTYLTNYACTGGVLSFNEELITANVQALPYLSDLDLILEGKKNNHETYLPNVHICIYQTHRTYPSFLQPSFSNPRVRCKSQPTGFIIGPTFHHFQLSYFPPLTNGLANPDSWLRREEGP